MKYVLYSLTLSCLLFGCTAQPADKQSNESPDTQSELAGVEEEMEEEASGVLAVEVTGSDTEGYTFSVEVQSPDTGCDRYANWWEVISEDGQLLYRRILAHSHVDEQPFERAGGPVEMMADEVVIVRSHMHPTGYQAQAMTGSFAEGFEPITVPPDFAIELAEAEPLPTGCAF